MSSQKLLPPPIIDFDPIGPAAHEHLLAFLMSPFDREKGRGFLAMRGAELTSRAPQYVGHYLANAPTARLRHSDPTVALARYQRLLERELIIPSGGLHALVNSLPPSQWEKEMDRMRKGPMVAAGRLLLFIVQMARHHPDMTASTRRATEILKAWKQAGGEIPADRELTQMWRRYGGVAPLYGAALLSLEDSPADPVGMGIAMSRAGSVRRLLSWAAWFRDFALSHKPKGAAFPLLRPDRTLILPPEIAPEEPLLRPLPPNLLAAAIKYRAPVPAQ